MKDLFKHIQQKFQSFLDGREEPDHSLFFLIRVLQVISSNMIRTASKLSLKILQKM